jgi:hypothetical protein
MEPQGQAETGRSFKRMVYSTLRTMSTAERKEREVLVLQIQPVTDWSLVWGILHNVVLPDGCSSAWYMVIHDIIPTNVRLHGIRLIDTEKCRQCGGQDTILHRFTGDLGMDKYTDSSDTKEEPEPYTQGMTPSSLFQTVSSTIIQTTLRFLASRVFHVMNLGMI